jgi:hypothetical protein
MPVVHYQMLKADPEIGLADARLEKKTIIRQKCHTNGNLNRIALAYIWPLRFCGLSTTLPRYSLPMATGAFHNRRQAWT